MMPHQPHACEVAGSAGTAGTAGTATTCSADQGVLIILVLRLEAASVRPKLRVIRQVVLGLSWSFMGCGRVGFWLLQG
jgi:hypothetical protein